RSRKVALDVFSAIQHAAQENPTLHDIAHSLDITPEALRHRLRNMRPDLGLRNGGTGQVFDYIKTNLDTIVRSAYGRPAADLEPIPPSQPRALDTAEWRLVGSALKYPTATITQLAANNHWPIGALWHAYVELGLRLNTGGTATDVLKYIRDHEQDLLGPGQTRDNLPEITPHQPRSSRSSGPLDDEDWRLIGSALKHPAATITQLATNNHWTESTLRNAYKDLGLRLDTGGTGTEVFKYIRDHEQDFLALLGPGQTRDTLPEITPRPLRPPRQRPLDEDDRQLIGSALTHRHLTLSGLARYYNVPGPTLRDRYERLGPRLEMSATAARLATAARVLDYIRKNENAVLTLAKHDRDQLPEIPRRHR
ncbi:hypothetical protein, partial [Streptomyces chartreusis]